MTKTIYICARCDRVYFSVSRSTWSQNAAKWNAMARDAKRSHRCPWDKRRAK